MKKTDYINDLMKIGLTESEAKVYFHLLKKKNFTATEISRLSTVSRRKVYEVLDRLIDKGLCTETIGKVRKFSAANPKFGFDSLINEFEEKRKVGLNLSQALLPLYLSEKENKGPLGYIEVINNLDQVGRRYLELVDNSETEVLSFMKPPYVIPPKEMSIRESKKGCKDYGIYEVRDSMSQEERDEFLLVISNISCDEELRIVKKVPVKMVIIDRKITMFTLDDPITFEPTLTAMVVTHPGFALLMRHIFMNIWEQSIPHHEFIKDKDWCLNK